MNTAQRAAVMTKLAEARAAKTPKAVKNGKPTKDIQAPASKNDPKQMPPAKTGNSKPPAKMGEHATINGVKPTPGVGQSEALAEEQTKQILRKVIVDGGQKDPGDGVSVEALMALAHALKLSVPDADSGAPPVGGPPIVTAPTQITPGA